MQNERLVGNGLFRIIKGVGVALGFAFLGVVIFAGVLRSTSISDRAIYPVNQTIKLLAVAIGTLVSVRGEKGYLQGAAVGLLFTALSYLTFSALGGSFALSWVAIVETLLSVLTGALSGAAAVNFRKNA